MRRRVITALGCAVALAACPQLEGIEQLPGAAPDSGAPDIGPACSALSTDSAGCSRCLQTSCCEETVNCDRDVACAQARRCLSACPPGDEPCRATCDVPLGHALNPLLVCTAQRCAGECGAICGGIVGIQVGVVLSRVVLPTCAPCVERLSCDVYETCASRVDCLDVIACTKACSPLDRSCNDGCVSNPELAAIKDKWSQLVLQCNSECGIGRNYGCLGRVAWPAPLSTGTSELTVPVVELGDALVPIEGADVKVCAEVPIETCTEIAAPAKSDAAGLARVRVPVTASVLGGFRGRLEISKEGYATVLRLAGPPPAGSQRLAPTPLIATAFLPFFAVQVGADGSGGTVAALVHDCLWATAPDVTLGIDAPSVFPFYFLSLTTISAKGPTTSAGLGGFFQVPTGNWELTAHVQVDAKDVVLGRRRIPVRAGALTVVDLVPSP